MRNLFNYRQPGQAAGTIRALQAAHPAVTFVCVSSPLPAYAFRYLIRATFTDGSNTSAFVLRTPRSMFHRLYTTIPQTH